MNEKWCPLCQAEGFKQRLKYCQVNFEEAIVLCENSKCIYPFGSTDVDSLVLKRSSQMDQRQKERPKSAEGKPQEKQGCTSSNGVASQFYWTNTDSLCWLDSVMTVLVNNRCLQLCLEKLQPKDSLLQKLYNEFHKAQKFGPVEEGMALLNENRAKVFEFLKSKMKCELGVNDSPLLSLSLLLKENSQISEKFKQEYRWNFKCASCGYVQSDRFNKWVVTFPNTPQDFCMPSGSFVRPCYKCKSPGQRSTLEFQGLPPCVIVHFVEGVSNEDFLKSRFVCRGKEYELYQLIQYKKNPDHFVAWVRNSNGTHWAEIDDTKDIVCKWCEGTPTIPLKEVHIAVWERTRLYRKNSTSTVVSKGWKQIEPQETVGGGNNQSSLLLPPHNSQSVTLLSGGNSQSVSLLPGGNNQSVSLLPGGNNQSVSLLPRGNNQSVSLLPHGNNQSVSLLSGGNNQSTYLLPRRNNQSLSLLPRGNNQSVSLLSGGNSQSVSFPLEGTKLSIKDPPLLRRTVGSSYCRVNEVQPGLNRATARSEGVRDLSEKNNSGVLCKNKERLKENLRGEKRKDLEHFAPYIPKKKRNMASKTTTLSNDETVVSQSISPGKENECGVDESVNKSNFLPWQDAVSLNVEQSKQCGDNQSDSGYSSPASNSSCLSLPMPTTEEASCLTDLLESLDSLDLPNIGKSSKCTADTKKDCQKNKDECVDVDQLLGEFFSMEENKKSLISTDTATNDSLDGIVDDILVDIL